MGNNLGVLQLIDSLHVGGAERMSINIANALVKEEVVHSCLVVTRVGGELEEFIDDKVEYTCLDKKGLTDKVGLKKLRKFIVKNNISVIHAHGSSVFWALFMKMRSPKIKVVWHDHFGMVEQAEVRPKEYRLLKYVKFMLHHYVVVNEMIKTWGMQNLGIKEGDITYLRNFAALDSGNRELKIDIPGTEGKRIVCLANLRFQKDHLFLVEIASKICKIHPDWSFICVGGIFEDDYSRDVKRKITDRNLEQNVFLLGSRTDVSGILNKSTIGILTSRSEGLPVALLEYGSAKLPVVCTNVGQCKEVVENAGFVVPHGDVDNFVKSLDEFIQSEKLRNMKANELHERAILEYSEKSAVSKLMDIYKN